MIKPVHRSVLQPTPKDADEATKRNRNQQPRSLEGATPIVQKVPTWCATANRRRQGTAQRTPGDAVLAPASHGPSRRGQRPQRRRGPTGWGPFPHASVTNAQPSRFLMITSELLLLLAAAKRRAPNPPAKRVE